MSTSPGRNRILIAILGASFLITLFLAVQAHFAVTYHRMTAMSVLQDYATLAADQLRNRAQGAIAVEANGMLGDIRGSLPLTSSQSPVHFERTFTPELIFSLPPQPGGGGTAVRSDSGTVSGALLGWIDDAVRAGLAEANSSWYFIGLGGLSPEGTLVLFAAADGARPAEKPIVGFAIRPSELAPVFSKIGVSALLPASLTNGARVDSGVALRVTLGDTVPVFQSSQGSGTAGFRGVAAFAPMFPPLRAEVAIEEGMAGRLLIGGLPKSRLPLIMALAALTGVLLLAAVFQLRREHDLARRQADFVSSVSHELRTPLAQLRMFSETLLLGRIRTPEEERRSLVILNQESRRLSHLVENLLHVARSDRREIRITPEPVLLAPALRDILDGFRPLATARRITINTEFDETSTAMVDHNALRQMVLNLLDNAVKYSPSESAIGVGTSQGAEGKVRIRIEDQGPGVPVAQRERIWHRFSRLNRDIESPIAGSGIGLAIVQELIEAHGGRCWVESGPSGGSRFILEFSGHSGGTGAIPEYPTWRAG